MNPAFWQDRLIIVHFIYIMPETNTKVRKTESIFKTIAKNPNRSQNGNGQTPAPVVDAPPQPAAAAPVATVGQIDPGQTPQGTPQATNQEPTQTPQQDPVPAVGLQPTDPAPAGPKEVVIDDPETIIVNGKGERYKAKDAEHYGFSRARQLQEDQRIANARKEVQDLAGNINAELSDPVIQDYRNLRKAHPEWTPQEARDAALRANGTVLPNAPIAPVEDEPLPKPPEGALPGEAPWDEWLVDVATKAANNASRKANAPIIADIESRKRAEEQRAQLDRVTSANLDLIRNKTQGFTHVDLDDLSEGEKSEFYGRVGETLAKRGLVYDGQSNRWNTSTGSIDENIYAFAVEASWPDGVSPKKAAPAPAPTQTPASVVAEHMNSGLGLVPDKQPTPTPTPPSAAMPTATPMRNPRAGRKSDNPLGDFLKTGRINRG